MVDPMAQSLIPYLLLLIAILATWASNLRVAAVTTAIAISAAIVFGRLDPKAVIAIFVLILTARAVVTDSIPLVLRGTCFAILLAMALGMFNHLVPGFRNLLVYDGVRFSPNSLPFFMYLNFDKAMAGLVMYVFLVQPDEVEVNGSQLIKRALLTLSVLLLVILTVALFTNYVQFDPKLPRSSAVWLLNNLFFVSFPEEVLFRGVIQRRLQNLNSKSKIWNFAAIGASAILFGLAHYKGGMSYIAFATIAGCFYGFAYFKTARIEAPILVHFGLNAIHFFFFSYPALA